MRGKSEIRDPRFELDKREMAFIRSRPLMGGLAFVVPGPHEMGIPGKSFGGRKLFDPVGSPQSTDSAKSRQSALSGNAGTRQHRNVPRVAEPLEKFFQAFTLLRARIESGEGTPPLPYRGHHKYEAKQNYVEDAVRLMARVRNRDAAAFEQLYDGYHRLVYGIALRILGDVAAAEDVTQAVFLKLWSSPALFAKGNFGAWIARVARNRALDVVRSRTVRSESELPDAMPLDDALEDTAFAHIDAEQVRSALSQLPEEQRNPIELGFFGGITHEDIARQTGIPLGTVKTRIRTGLRKLRMHLDGMVTV